MMEIQYEEFIADLIDYLKGEKCLIDEKSCTMTEQFEDKHKWEISNNVMINKTLKKIDELYKEKIYLSKPINTTKKHRLEVKLMNKDELLVIEGNDNINMPDIIEQYFNQEKEFICFGYIGVRRSEIEWYAITEAVEGGE